MAVNHYCRPGFPAWWIGLAISATFPNRIHWSVTSAWVYPDMLRSLTITPLSRWFLKRLTACYGFSAMPPMPPRPQDTLARAAAVRSLLRYVEHTPSPVLGIAPEGADSMDGQLAPPPPGVGRLLWLLFQRGLMLVPCGVFEERGRLVVHYGDSIQPPLDNLIQAKRDTMLASFTMRAIAACLPPHLHGPYA